MGSNLLTWHNEPRTTDVILGPRVSSLDRGKGFSAPELRVNRTSFVNDFNHREEEEARRGRREFGRQEGCLRGKDYVRIT